MLCPGFLVGLQGTALQNMVKGLEAGLTWTDHCVRQTNAILNMWCSSVAVQDESPSVLFMDKNSIHRNRYSSQCEFRRLYNYNRWVVGCEMSLICF